jgi:hypothetical protein
MILNPPVLNHQIVAWQDFLDSFQERHGSRNVPQGQVFVKGKMVEPAGHRFILEDGFQLGCKQNTSGFLAYVERFLPQAISSEDKAGSANVPQSDPEHPAQMLEQIEAFLFIEMDKDFRIRTTLKHVSLGLKHGTEFPKVVDLPITDNPHGLVFVGDGLMAAFEVNDAEPSHSHGNAMASKMSVIVWPPMDLNLGHSVQQRAVRNVG